MESRKPNAAQLTSLNTLLKNTSAGLLIRIGACLILAALLAGVFYAGSSASSLDRNLTAPGNQTAKAVSPVASSARGISTILRVPAEAPFLPVPPAPVTVATYASNCTTSKTLFNLADADKTVCAVVTGALPGWRIIWSNANFVAVQNNLITSDPQSSTFTLAANSSLGDWRVIVFEPFGGSVEAVTSFTVIDAANPVADLQIFKSPVSNQAAAGGQVVYALQVTNAGPSSAVNAVFTDAVPANTTFVSLAQLSGPVFSCANPTAGSTGTTTCTIGSLAKGDTATFIATYQVDGGATVGTQITNTANVSSDTFDNNTFNPETQSSNNSSTASVNVAAAPCVISCPSNISQPVDAGQAGAIVNYSTPGFTGNCGTASTGENGEPIPIISCSPASGSFFGVGTTSVGCVSQTGDACTFQVTIDNPGGLSITLNGANPFTTECGDDFNDPGASAVNGTGQSVPVVVTLPQGFDPAGPAVGSYTLIYTATEGQNSVHTERTVNVVDTLAPVITISGSNPFKLQLGSCPFVDPGVSATDGCQGAVTVSSSVTGPNGATAIDPNVAGTYTVHYSASDTATPTPHTTTKTRTVIVGDFPPDQVDQGNPSGLPTITLVGDQQITLECGMTFTDPGATATVGCASVSVTTSGTVDIHTPGNYTITYSATSAAGTVSTTRIVTVGPDNSPPTITVTGANPMTVECHTSFADPGAVAHDLCAGDFPATASGTVDPNTVGPYTITYNATDPSGHAATPVTRTVNVVDTTAPVVTAPPAVIVFTGTGSTSCSVTVSDATLGTASANDACQGPLSTTRSGVPSGNVFPVGQTTITYSATDAHNNTGTATQTVTVIDNTPPVITTNGQTLSMWPPNHKYHTFTVANFVTGVSDNCDATLGIGSVAIEKVTSDEIENGNGDGNTLNDIVIAPDCRSVQLRAEREGGGDGRVYTIFFSVTDASGNIGRATAKVVVPHNPGETPVDSGPHYTVSCGL